MDDSPSSNVLPAASSNSSGSITLNGDGTSDSPSESMARAQQTLPSMRISTGRATDDGSGRPGLEPATVPASNGLGRHRPREGAPRGSPKKRKRSLGSDVGPRKSPVRRSPSTNDANAAVDANATERVRYSDSDSPRRNHHGWTPTSYPPLVEENGVLTSGREIGPWYGQRSPETRLPYEELHSAPAVQANSLDARLAEALQRENRRLDSQRATSLGGTPDNDDPNGRSTRGSDHGADRTPTSAVQTDPRKRKRVFSNRTKTGCMTCRRRKKKCDEQKPECTVTAISADFGSFLLILC